MSPRKILVVRQKVKEDGSVTLEPVAWKDDAGQKPFPDAQNREPSPSPSTTSLVESQIMEVEPMKELVSVPGIVTTECLPTVAQTPITSFEVDGVDSLSTTPDVDFLSSASCDTESVNQSVENDKMLNYPEDTIDRDWMSGDFDSEVIDEMLVSSFVVPPNQEENLVPELGITEPIEDAALAALKYAPEKTICKKKKSRPIRTATPHTSKSRRKAMPYAYPCKCELCDTICHTKNQYKSHRMYHHSPNKFVCENPNKERKCEYCDKTFSLKAAFVKHQRTMHWKELNIEEPRYPCRWCDRVYVASSSRIYHEMTIHRPKSFPCPLCGLEFKAYENLTKHLKTHNASCLRCFKCHNLFSTVDSLKKHFELRHTDVEFDDNYITTNRKAHEEITNGTFVNGKRKARKGRNLPTMTFENMERLDEFLRENPNYQIVQTDENGQTTYQLVELVDAAQNTDLNEQFVTAMTDSSQLSTDTQADNKTNVVDLVHQVSSMDSTVETTPNNEGCDENVSDGTQVPQFELDDVRAAIANMPDLKGKLAYRCQMCSMVFADTEALMKHCLVKHQEIAQVVLV